MRSIRVLIAGMIVVPVLYLAILSGAAWRSGLTWREMDFNGDGTTSFREFLTAGDVGKRMVRAHGRACTEFFWLKDGLPLKVVCPSS